MVKRGFLFSMVLVLVMGFSGHLRSQKNRVRDAQVKSTKNQLQPINLAFFKRVDFAFSEVTVDWDEECQNDHFVTITGDILNVGTAPYIAKRHKAHLQYELMDPQNFNHLVDNQSTAIPAILVGGKWKFEFRLLKSKLEPWGVPSLIRSRYLKLIMICNVGDSVPFENWQNNFYESSFIRNPCYQARIAD